MCYPVNDNLEILRKKRRNIRRLYRWCWCNETNIDCYIFTSSITCLLRVCVTGGVVQTDQWGSRVEHTWIKPTSTDADAAASLTCY